MGTTKTLNVVIENAYATEADWIKKNPVLYPGQDAISIDKFGKRKTGDGSTHWVDLPYNKSSSLTINGEEYNGSIDTYINIMPLIIGTQTAATGAWLGTASMLDSLEDGTTIRYWLPRSGSGNATLNLTLKNGTTTGAKNCYYGGTTRLTTHYPAGSLIILTYFKAANINGTSYEGWWAQSNYDSNDYYRIRYQQAIKAASAITAGNLIVSNGTGGYFHLKSGGAFDISYPVLYSSGAISSGATGTYSYICSPLSIATTQSITLTPYKPMYIKGTLSGTTFTPVSTTPLTQTVPTTNDGYTYMWIGMAYSTSSMYLLPDQKLYRYINGSFSQFTLNAHLASSDSSGQIITSTYIKGLSVSGKVITYTKGDGNTGTITTQDTNTTYSAGTGLALSGTTFNHKNSITAGTAQGDTTKSLTFGGTFTIPTITYDAQGHITGKGTTTMTMPANPNVDTKVTQTNTATSADYRLIFSGNASDATETTTVRKNPNFLVNPSTGELFVNGFRRIDITGQTIDLNNYNLNSGKPHIQRYICKTTGGSSNISNKPSSDGAFILDVEVARYSTQADYITKQTFTLSANKTVYIRYCTNDVWSAWVVDITSGNYTNYAPPKSHASSANTYGIGTASLFGHVKLSDTYTSAQGAASTGMAPSQTALYNVYNTLNTKFNSYLPLAGGTVTGTVILSKTTDLSGLSDNSPALIIGGTRTSVHMEIDSNEIHAKANGTSVGQLNLNTDGGLVHIGSGGMSTPGIIRATNTTEASSHTSGSIVVSGGLGVAKQIITNSKLYVGHSTAANAIIYMNGKEAVKGIDTWLRINESKAFTAGIYFGSSLVRVDGTLQVGSAGSSLNVTTSAIQLKMPTTISNTVAITNTTGSSSTTTGALKVSGGVGVTGQMSANKVMIGNHCTIEYSNDDECLNFVFS